MSKSLIFATTNLPKVKRLSAMIDSPKIKILTLGDFANINLKEPEETGETELENAIIKLEYYKKHLKTQLPIIAQDDGIYTPELPDDYNPGKNIKAIISRHLGKYNHKNTFLFWKDIASSYPDYSCIIVNAFALHSVQTVVHQCKIECKFVPNHVVLYQDCINGDVLSPFLATKIDGEYKVFKDFNDNDYVKLSKMYHQPIIESIKAI